MLTRFHEKFLPYYAPDTEDGAAAPAITPAPQDGDGGGAAEAPPEKAEKLSIRDALKKGFDDARKADADAAAPAPKGKKEKPARAAEEMRAEAEEPSGDATPPAEEAPAPVEAPKSAPPAAWAKDAKDTWASLPAQVQAAVLKRETDVQKGVDELKAKYSDVDQAFAPHIDAIRQHGHTPAQALTQMFGWFQALSRNPDVAFPALLRSFNYDPAKLAPQQQQTQAQQPAAAADGTKKADQPDGNVPPAVQQYIDGITNKLAALENAFQQKIGAVENTFQQQSEAKTQEILMNWSKDKPHFDKVRVLMSQLIASGAVPLKEGRVDLDGAYEQAIWANPEVRAEVQATAAAAAEKARKDAAEKEAKAQAAAAEKARKAAVSLAPSAPGEAPKPVRKKGRSVRESLMEAIQEQSV